MRTLVASVVIAGCGFHGAPSTGQPIDAAPDPFQDAPGTGIDAAPAVECYSSGSWKVCLGSKPTTPVTLMGMLDTEHDPRCLGAQPAGWYPTQPSACFVIGSTITIPLGQTLRAFGKKPLVLVADTTITVAGTLDAASHRSGGSGPAAGSSECTPWVASPKNGQHGGSGGGAGGTFMTKGGDGGAGDNGKGANGQAPTGGTAPAKLRGGCNGQHGYTGPGGFFGPSPGGAGGGAVYLVAGTRIDVTGAINVSGAGGDGNRQREGGNGGGSGGMIVLNAPTVTTTTLVANGGGGASGGTSNTNGSDGTDGNLPNVVATGGEIGANGGTGYAATVDATDGSSAGTGDGGGGGGGGAGYVQSNQVLPALPTISPAATYVAP